MLIVFAGLPGTGKSTIARAIARKLRATYLRIDTIEQALRNAGTLRAELTAEGYLIAYQLAEENLRLGGVVIADSVNPIPLTRDAWLAVAERAAARAVEVEVICSDKAEHRRRVETRTVDVPRLEPPSWPAVESRDYAPWTRERLVIDTAAKSVPDSVAELLARLERSGAR